MAGRTRAKAPERFREPIETEPPKRQHEERQQQQQQNKASKILSEPSCDKCCMTSANVANATSPSHTFPKQATESLSPSEFVQCSPKYSLLDSFTWQQDFKTAVADPSLHNLDVFTNSVESVPRFDPNFLPNFELDFIRSATDLLPHTSTLSVQHSLKKPQDSEWLKEVPSNVLDLSRVTNTQKPSLRGYQSELTTVVENAHGNYTHVMSPSVSSRRSSSLLSSYSHVCQGMTALHISAERGSESIVQFLLCQGVDVNGTDNLGRTALHYASNCANIEVVQQLLEGGADPDAQDCEGWTPLHAAADAKWEAIFRLLVQEGADFNAATGVMGK